MWFTLKTFGLDRAVPHEEKARVVRDLAPLVEVEGERVGELEACEQRRVLRREDGEAAERAVDVEPEVLFLRDGGDGREIVDGSAYVLA